MCSCTLYQQQLDDEAEVRKMAEELNAKVGRMQSTLQRISAPNMRALEKYVVVYSHALGWIAFIKRVERN